MKKTFPNVLLLLLFVVRVLLVLSSTFIFSFSRYWKKKKKDIFFIFFTRSNFFSDTVTIRNRFTWMILFSRLPINAENPENGKRYFFHVFFQLCFTFFFTIETTAWAWQLDLLHRAMQLCNTFAFFRTRRTRRTLDYHSSVILIKSAFWFLYSVS